MTTPSGPVYENRVFIEPDAIGDYDAWIRQRAAGARRAPGVADASVFPITADEHGRPGRCCQFSLRDDEALEAFIDGPATEYEADAIERFGDRISWYERILREDTSQDLPAGEMPVCLNCGMHLRGQYCGECGQRARSRLISLWQLVREAFGDLFELDSRLWRTVVPLLARPGQLTHDYLQGRRARYMPPFRMYLVLSLLFFLVAFFNPRETFGIFFEPQAPVENQVQDESKIEETAAAAEGDLNIRFDGDGAAAADCRIEEFEISGPEWLKRRLTPERLQHICEQMKKDKGRQFIANLVDNVPVALIVLLPIMAFVLQLLYPLSRRYYVEHLLFFVHFHAFVFLILILQLLVGRASAVLPIPEAIGVLIIIVASFYVPVYLFIAMRRVYGQGRVLTSIKYLVLTTCYIGGLTLTMLGAVTMAAFAI